MEPVETNQYEEEFMKKIQNEFDSKEDFLEKSLINEIKQTINLLENKCQGKMGESVVDDRIRQLSILKY